MITRYYFCTFSTLFLLFLLSCVPLTAQQLADRDSSSSTINDKEITKAFPSKDKLFELKKELLLFELQYRQKGNHLAFENKWQIRLLFLFFTGSFVTMCFSSSAFRGLNISGRTKWISTVILFLLFITYDVQQSSLHDRSLARSKTAAELLNNLENISYSELKDIEPFPLSPSDEDKWNSRFEQLYKLETYLLYLFLLISWIVGWRFKDRKK